MILSKSLVIGIACVGWALAQNTDPQFPIKANNTLGVRFANDSTTAGPDKKAIQTPGELWSPSGTFGLLLVSPGKPSWH